MLYGASSKVLGCMHILHAWCGGSPYFHSAPTCAHGASQHAAQGCDTFTFSPAVAQQMLAVPQTLQAVQDFHAAAKRNV
jgi:hypothetical protein